MPLPIAVICILAGSRMPSARTPAVLARSHTVLVAGHAARRLRSTGLYRLPEVFLIPSWLPDGRESMAGWVGRALLGENQLAAFRNAQQVFLPVMLYDDFPCSLHEVHRGDPPALRTGHSAGVGLVSGCWCLCHSCLHLGWTPSAFCGVVCNVVKMKMIIVIMMQQSEHKEASSICQLFSVGGNSRHENGSGQDRQPLRLQDQDTPQVGSWSSNSVCW